MSAADSVLLDEQITIADVDAARYERVCRVSGSNASGDLSIVLDVNTELYPLSADDAVNLSVVSRLTDEVRDGADYIMYGKVYKFDEGSGEKTSAYVSFGGLLLKVEGDYRKLARLSHGDVYLCLRK